MATIVTRSGKGSALTHNEMDANFTNLNNDKPDSSDLRTINGTSLIGEGDITVEIDLTDSVSTTSSEIAASATAVKTAYDKAVENGPLILTPGTKQLSETSRNASTASSSYTKVIEYFTASAGEALISFDLRSSYSIATAYARIYINGVAVGTERSSGYTLTNFQENITFERGDYIQLYVKQVTGGEARIESFEILVDELPYSRYTL